MVRTFQDLPQISWLPDRKRLQMRHGPIDLLINAIGPQPDIRQAYRQAAHVFKTTLNDLAHEIDILRRPLDKHGPLPQGKIARKMHHVAHTLTAGAYATPMIAVAGAVADHILTEMRTTAELDKIYVNNGGDIALYLAPGHSYDIGVCSDPYSGKMASSIRIVSGDAIGGIATSGWRGRSHSLGIADAVTVLAKDAASADTAATLIANAINLPRHPAIKRIPANQLAPDSDLGNKLVTVDVEPLSDVDIKAALSRGYNLAEKMIGDGLVISVFASLQSGMFNTTNGIDLICDPQNEKSSAQIPGEPLYA